MTYSSQIGTLNHAYIQDLLGPGNDPGQYGHFMWYMRTIYPTMEEIYALDRTVQLYDLYKSYCAQFVVDPQTGRIAAAQQAAVQVLTAPPKPPPVTTIPEPAPAFTPVIPIVTTPVYPGPKPSELKPMETGAGVSILALGAFALLALAMRSSK